MRQLKAQFLLVLFIVATAATFATGAAPSGPESEVLSIAYPMSVSSVPLLELIASYPEDYTGQFFTDHPQALAQLVVGETDVLATGFSVGYSRYQSTGDIVHLSTTVWGVSALMSSEPVSRFRDMPAGLLYAPFEGSPIDFYLKAAISEAGLEDQLEIAYAPFPQAAALLAQGRASGAVLVEPIASRLELNGAAYRVENLHDGWARVYDVDPRSPQVSIFVMEEYSDSKQSAFELLAMRLAEIVEEVRDNPALFARRYSDDLAFSQEEVTRAIENTLFDTPSPATTKALIEKYVELLGLAAPSSDFYADLE